MMTPRSQIRQHALEALTVVFVLGVLSVIWPGILAIVLGLFLLIQSFGPGQEMAILSWAEISNVPMVLASLRRSDTPAVLS